MGADVGAGTGRPASFEGERDTKAGDEFEDVTEKVDEQLEVLVVAVTQELKESRDMLDKLEVMGVVGSSVSSSMVGRAEAEELGCLSMSLID